jgi:hypothetical protein
MAVSRAGKQTRSFCLVDDCVEGLLRLMRSDVTTPLNIGSSEMVSMNALQALALSFRADGVRVRRVCQAGGFGWDLPVLHVWSGQEINNGAGGVGGTPTNATHQGAECGRQTHGGPRGCERAQLRQHAGALPAGRVGAAHEPGGRAARDVRGDSTLGPPIYAYDFRLPASLGSTQHCARAPKLD